MSDLVQIEYHPPCTFYGDEGCIEQTGEYVCACGASTAWHKTTPVKIDYEAAIENRHMYGRPKCYEGLDEDGCYCRKQVTEDVNAALGIGGGDE